MQRVSGYSKPQLKPYNHFCVPGAQYNGKYACVRDFPWFSPGYPPNIPVT